MTLLDLTRVRRPRNYRLATGIHLLPLK